MGDEGLWSWRLTEETCPIYEMKIYEFAVARLISKDVSRASRRIIINQLNKLKTRQAIDNIVDFDFWKVPKTLLSFFSHSRAFSAPPSKLCKWERRIDILLCISKVDQNCKFTSTNINGNTSILVELIILSVSGLLKNDIFVWRIL